MRKKLRPDVASDTSRRNNNCVTTQHLIHRDVTTTASRRSIRYVATKMRVLILTITIYGNSRRFSENYHTYFYAEYQPFAHTIWQLKQRIQTFFLFFLHQSNDIPRPKTPYGKYSHHEDKYICSNTTYEDSTAMSLQSHIP